MQKQILLKTVLMEEFSYKEKAILKLIAAGRTSQEIADELHLSLPTIKWYRKKMKEKTASETTVEMIRKAIENKLL